MPAPSEPCRCLQLEAMPVLWEGKASDQGHTASAWQSWAEASMWVAASLLRKLVLLGHLASVRRPGERLESPTSLLQEEEPPPLVVALRVWRAEQASEGPAPQGCSTIFSLKSINK